MRVFVLLLKVFDLLFIYFVKECMIMLVLKFRGRCKRKYFFYN